jgi:hypothetical protein
MLGDVIGAKRKFHIVNVLNFTLYKMLFQFICKRIRWMWHKSRMGEVKNSSNNLAGSLEGKRLIIN